MSPALAFLNGSYRTFRRVVIAVVGFTVLVIGIIMLVTPGPAFVVIPVGLGILAVEFAWARRWLKKIKEKAQQGADYMRGKGQASSSENPCEAPAAEESNALTECQSNHDATKTTTS